MKRNEYVQLLRQKYDFFFYCKYVKIMQGKPIKYHIKYWRQISLITCRKITFKYNVKKLQIWPKFLLQSF